jgi:uncharacterized cupredoxin-like copper-binding protein
MKGRAIRPAQKILVLLGACLWVLISHAEGGHEDPTNDWMPPGINWKEAETVTVLLEDNVFTPDEVVFKQYKPYKLVLHNISDSVTHDLVDQNFFHSIVLKKITIGGATVNTPHMHNLKLRPNSSANLYIVPIKPGEYEVFCSVSGHREDGMEGYFTIKP